MSSQGNGQHGGDRLTLAVPSELIDAIARRVVELFEARGLMGTQESSPYLDADEAAEYLRCSKQAVYDRVHSGVIAPRRDGRRLLFRRSDLDAYVEGRQP